MNCPTIVITSRFLTLNGDIYSPSLEKLVRLNNIFQLGEASMKKRWSKYDFPEIGRGFDFAELEPERLDFAEIGRCNDFPELIEASLDFEELRKRPG